MKKQLTDLVNEVGNPKGFPRKLMKNIVLYEQVKQFIDVNDIENINEAIYCIVNDTLPSKCPCGKKALFNSYTHGYRKFCSSTCPSKGNAHSKSMSTYWQDDGETKKQNMVTSLKNTMISRYGVDSIMRHPDLKKKVEETNIQKYGVKYPLLNKDIIDSIKENNIQKHGVEFPFQSDAVRKKAADTFEKNHGFKNDMSIPRQAFIDKYGKNPFQVETIKESIKTALIEKYGHDHPMKVDEIYNKAITTLHQNHGKLNPAQLHIPDEAYRIINDPIQFEELLEQKTITEIQQEYQISGKVIRTYHDKYELDLLPISNPKSRYEEEIAEFLDKNNISYTRNKHDICKPLQLDFYLQDNNLAIEFNGLYWHSEYSGKKSKDYHAIKQQICESKNIQLLTVFEDEWLNKSVIIKNKILHLCQQTTNIIGARKIELSLHSNPREIKTFLENYHIQGKTEGTSIAIVGKYNNEMVAVMTLRKHKEGHDMTRYCIKNDAAYPGLFSKFLKFIEKNSLCETIVTFADLRWSSGDVYTKTGFELVDRISPDYSYTDYKNRDHKFNYRKDRIKSKFGIDVSGKTELELTRELGLDRIWDCGKLKYKKKL